MDSSIYEDIYKDIYNKINNVELEYINNMITMYSAVDSMPKNISTITKSKDWKTYMQQPVQSPNWQYDVDFNWYDHYIYVEGVENDIYDVLFEIDNRNDNIMHNGKLYGPAYETGNPLTFIENFEFNDVYIMVNANNLVIAENREDAENLTNCILPNDILDITIKYKNKNLIVSESLYKDIYKSVISYITRHAIYTK